MVCTWLRHLTNCILITQSGMYLYYNYEKYPPSPLKPRFLVLIKQYLPNISDPVYSVHQSFMWFLWLNWRKSTFYPVTAPNDSKSWAIVTSSIQEPAASNCDATMTDSSRMVAMDAFYLRPVLAFGYCRCLRVSVCLCVRQSWACPSDNSSTVQARITKFGPEKQNTLVKIPIVFWGNWPWPSRSNLTSNSKLTPFWACPNHYSPPILVRISKLGQEMHFSTVKIPVNWGLDWPWTSPSFLIPKLIFLHCGGVHWDCETAPGLF